MQTFDLTLDEIAKIEGKASVTIQVKDDVVTKAEFAITEYKRFYTAALKNKDVAGLPQLSCRICGTCSNAHLICAIMAAEQALGIVPSEQTILLRKLVNYGLLIRDHALHCYVFALPDVFEIDNILELNENDPKQNQVLEDTFAVKAVGNLISKAIGGRSVHAPYPTIGGFVKIPKQEDFPKLIEELKKIRPAALRLIQIFVDYPFTLEREMHHMALMNADFSFLGGEILDTNGMKFNPEEYDKVLEHVDVPYSHASGYKVNGTVHMTGALARLNLAKNNLHPDTKRDCEKALALFPSKNIYHNNLAQAIEILHAIDSSITILSTLNLVAERPAMITRKAGVGVGVIEAPRGLLFYKIVLNEKGSMTDVQIVVPTGQNQVDIEESIKTYLNQNLSKDKDTLSLDIEKIVRAYDPCMSCASHFLQIKWI